MCALNAQFVQTTEKVCIELDSGKHILEEIEKHCDMGTLLNKQVLSY